MKTLVLFLIAVIIWCAGINGKLGSILAAVVDPGSLVKGTLTNNIRAGDSGGGSGFAGDPNVNGSSGSF